jgi:hypothetical protein
MKRITTSAEDEVLGCSEMSNSTVQEFWKWAFGDLCDDDVKGIFAEWIVHKLLGIATRRRISWANSDITTPGGTRIEVKSTSYWQSWKFLNEDGSFREEAMHTSLKDDKKIRFANLRSRGLVSQWSGKLTYKSHFYIFAFQKESSIEAWNALNLGQWEFFLLSVQELEALNTNSVSLDTLRKKFKTLSASELAFHGRAAIVNHEASKDKS